MWNWIVILVLFAASLVASTASAWPVVVGGPYRGYYGYGSRYYYGARYYSAPALGFPALSLPYQYPAVQYVAPVPPITIQAAPAPATTFQTMPGPIQAVPTITAPAPAPPGMYWSDQEKHWYQFDGQTLTRSP